MPSRHRQGEGATSPTETVVATPTGVRRKTGGSECTGAKEKARCIMRVNKGTGLPMAALLLAVPMAAHAGSENFQASHYGFSGVIAKIHSGVLFVKTDNSLQPRTISPTKADRVGLYDARVGDTVNMIVDSGNVLMDAAKTDRFFPDHHFVSGTLRYADPYWTEIQISTPEGFERIDVDALAGNKLSVFQEGQPVTLELDADNVMVDIYRGR